MTLKARLALAVILFCSPLLNLAAQETDSITSIVDQINASGVIRVSQPDGLNQEIRRQAGVALTTEVPESEEESAVRPGYRVQVFDDNNPRSARSQAEHVSREVNTRFPEYHTYVTFNSPYWRVKAGDFRTRAEAEQALAEIRAAMPRLNSYLRIVRDKINTQ